MQSASQTVPDPRFDGLVMTVGSLSSGVFERHTSTGRGLFAHLSRDFEQTFGQIVSMRVQTLSHTKKFGSVKAF